jgi:hypothetical protein
MAGRKQHFIQQHLIKGFSYDYPRDPCHVWVYRKDRSPFPTATAGYGAERDFYGKPGGESLDERITDAEAEHFNGFISLVRDGPLGAVDSTAATAFAIHVMARSKNIRSMLTEGVEAIMVHAGPIMSDPKFQEQLIVRSLREDPRMFAKLGLQLDADSRPSVARKVQKLLLKLARKFVRQKSSEIGVFMQTFLGNLREFVAEGQRRTLQKLLNELSGTRVRELQSLHWQSFEAPRPLVLGDSVVFVELTDGRFKTATEPGDQLRSVWLPVSSKRLLRGARGPDDESINVANINRGAVACSYDSFCAMDGPSAHVDLIPLIRTATFSLDEVSARRIALEGIHEVSR